MFWEVGRGRKLRVGRHLRGVPVSTLHPDRDPRPGPVKVSGDHAEGTGMSSAQVVYEPKLGSLTYEEDIRDCAFDEVCVVRVGDRVLVLPIGPELAALSGFDVLVVEEHYLTALGVKPRPGPQSVSNHSGLAGDQAVSAPVSVPAPAPVPGPVPVRVPAHGFSPDMSPDSIDQTKIAHAVESEPVAGVSTSSMARLVESVHSPIAAQLIDWSVLDAAVEPAKPLDVASATREVGASVSQIGWPDVDRPAPEMVGTSPAAFDPNALVAGVRDPNQKRAEDSATITSTPGIAQEASITEIAVGRLTLTGTGMGPGHAAAFVPFESEALPASDTLASVVVSRLAVADGVEGSEGVPQGRVSFVLSPGEAMEVGGASDADLLLLFRTLAGFVPPAAGSMYVDGEDRSSLLPQERLRREALRSGALFDGVVLIPERSVATNLEIPLLAAGNPPATARAVAASRIETMGLSALGRHRVDSLSPDLRVLVGAARSLMLPSPLVVIAMQTHSMADEAVRWLHALVDQARQRGSVIVYHTDDLRFGVARARTAVLTNGSLIPGA